MAFSTWLNVDRVVENAQPTPRQQLKSIASPKHIAERSHSCGVPWVATPT